MDCIQTNKDIVSVSSTEVFIALIRREGKFGAMQTLDRLSYPLFYFVKLINLHREDRNRHFPHNKFREPFFQYMFTGILQFLPFCRL